jgi:RNA-binding protein YlmH
MNLGIERNKMGDILLMEDHAVLFIREEICSYIAENLTKIKHTIVQTNIMNITDISYKPKFEVIKGNVASVRLDTVLTTAYPMSRSKMTAYIEAGKVFVNGKLVTSNGYHLKEHDIISVRGLGRIQYEEILGSTKKGRYMVSVKKFI